MPARATPQIPISFLRLPAVRLRTGLPRATLYSLMQRGEFPRPISLGGRSVAWVNTDIERWMLSRVSASRRSAPRA